MSKELCGVSCGENWRYDADLCFLRTQQFNLSPNFHLAWNWLLLQRYHSSLRKRNVEKITVKGRLSAAGLPQWNKCVLGVGWPRLPHVTMKHRSTSIGSKVYLMSWDGGWLRLFVPFWCVLSSAAITVFLLLLHTDSKRQQQQFPHTSGKKTSNRDALCPFKTIMKWGGGHSLILIELRLPD